MIPADLWLAYIATVVAIVLSPGPSVLLIGSQRMLHGRGAVLPTILGDLSANVLQMTVAALGLAIIISASSQIFSLIKWAGVLYLITLGIARIQARPSTARAGAQPGSQTHAPPLSCYARGFMVSAANPKAVVFFASFFPLFIDSGRPWFPQVVALATTFVVLDGTALLGYARAGASLKSWLSRYGKAHWEGRITGSMLIGAGLALAAKRLD